MHDAGKEQISNMQFTSKKVPPSVKVPREQEQLKSSHKPSTFGRRENLHSHHHGSVKDPCAAALHPR